MSTYRKNNVKRGLGYGKRKRDNICECGDYRRFKIHDKHINSKINKIIEKNSENIYDVLTKQSLEHPNQLVLDSDNVLIL